MTLERDDSPVAIVTGGSGGIGRAYVRGLLDAGYRVVVADRADPAPDLREASTNADRILMLRVDVSDQHSTESMAESVLAGFGRIDVLINNAAYFSAIVKKPLEEISVEEWDLAFAVNVRGAWLCACAVLPAMKRQGHGRIINTSSMTFHGGGIAGFAHYASTKAAVVGLTRSMARELGDFGITVNTISPDYIAHAGGLFNRQPEMASNLAAQRSIKREGTPEDLIGTVLFLAGPGADFVTGQDIWVNGGRIFG
jgi:3-oxoacyl-[acyl-carrier protein] reductase